MSLPVTYEAVESKIVGRYRVEKRSGGGFWPYCVKGGTGTMELFIGHRTQCAHVAQALQTACLDGAFMAAKIAPDMLGALKDALEYIAEDEDVCDGNDGFQVPNRAMQLAQSLRAVLKSAKGE